MSAFVGQKRSFATAGLDNVSASFSLDAFIQNAVTAPWQLSGPLALLECVLFICASFDYIVFTLMFLQHLISTWRFATLSQRIMSFVVMLSFLAIRTLYIPVLFLFAPLSSVPQFALDSLKASIICITVVFLYTLLLPTLAGLYGAFQFESWSSSTNSEMGQDKLKHMLSSGKLAQVVVMVHINKENISAIVRTIKSLVRSTYDPRYLVVHLCFNPAVLPKSYQQVIQFLQGKTHDPLPPQGYPLRYTIEYENVQFVLHRGKQHDQGAVFCEIQQNFQGVNHRTYLLSFAADTILYEDCIVEMVYAMESRNDSIGVTGFVTGTCPSRGSVFRHFQEAEFVTEETIDRSLEMAFGNKASVPCALTMVHLGEFERVAKSYLTKIGAKSFDHLISEQLVLHVLTQQHKSNMLKFCPNARAKTEAATSWATMFQQESRWHMPLAANKAFFMVDLNLWAKVPLVQLFRVLRMSGMSMRLFAHLSIIQVIFGNSFNVSNTLPLWMSLLSTWIMLLGFSVALRRSSLFFMFPLTFIVNPWMRLATNVANILYLQTDTIPTKERVIQVKDIEVGYNVPKLDSSKPMEGDTDPSIAAPDSPQPKPGDGSRFPSEGLMSHMLRTSKSFESLHEPDMSKYQHSSSIARLVRTSSMRGLKSSADGLASPATTPSHTKNSSGSYGVLHHSNSANFKLFGRH
ncbi:hypothetical protein BASA50_005944 [Batrachochytrium salamandrivorans]|uniref:Chitin synthase n=1 Tax=Batrachochytrium salamandrivorans TaxID=1357716 RepID=A0ABQ8FBS9_9FUNG|nr:hypothetical protein BASA50_005944 [Batrachochytrium salamandrivorans]KAH9264639.1 hypothetical protein BASA83_011891 [Batrachochytrium salamandrivorans]